MNEKEFLRQTSMLLRKLTGCPDAAIQVSIYTKSEMYHIREDSIEVYSN